MQTENAKRVAAALATMALPPRGPWKKIKDQDTGEVVGSIRTIGDHIEWQTPNAGGYKNTRAEALAAIEHETLQTRACAAADRARRAEIDDLPEPLRTLRIELDRAKLRYDLEYSRFPSRPADLEAARRWLADATMAFDAAERFLVERAA